MGKAEEQQECVIRLALQIAKILRSWPNRIDAKAALVIAGELFSLDAPPMVIAGKSASSADNGLHKN
jgi:hypothetical protein